MTEVNLTGWQANSFHAPSTATRTSRMQAKSLYASLLDFSSGLHWKDPEATRFLGL
ncbi:MAG: hypothetical protein OXC26_05735 [Albidovulum sp.]|nr:hypothetical protein [Albidovulum sp.]